MTVTIFDLDCCPLCRGKGGFTYRAVIRGIQFRSWDGENNHFADLSTSHGAYRCDDCGKIIRQKDIATKLPRSESDPRASTSYNTPD